MTYRHDTARTPGPPLGVGRGEGRSSRSDVISEHQAWTADFSGEERLLRLTEVIDLTRVSRTTILALVRRGDLPVVRIGRALRFRRSDVAALMVPRPNP